MSNLRALKTGDKVIYTSDVQPEYKGQVATVMDFDIESRLVSLETADKEVIVAFWNEILGTEQ